jgi:hypothetical protein
MRRRRAIGGLVALALAGVAAVALWPRSPRPCRATFAQIRKGMAYEEVCATVGAPPGTYSDRVVPLLGLAHAGWTYDRRWTAHDGGMLVTFRERDDTVEFVCVADPLPDHRSFVQRLRARIGL